MCEMLYAINLLMSVDPALAVDCTGRYFPNASSNPLLGTGLCLDLPSYLSNICYELSDNLKVWLRDTDHNLELDVSVGLTENGGAGLKPDYIYTIVVYDANLYTGSTGS